MSVDRETQYSFQITAGDGNRPHDSLDSAELTDLQKNAQSLIGVTTPPPRHPITTTPLHYTAT